MKQIQFGQTKKKKELQFLLLRESGRARPAIHRRHVYRVCFFFFIISAFVFYYAVSYDSGDRLNNIHAHGTNGDPDCSLTRVGRPISVRNSDRGNFSRPTRRLR